MAWRSRSSLTSSSAAEWTCDPISAELTYGLERIAAFLQDVDSIYDIVWARDPETGQAMTYGDVRLADELQFSVYNFETADVREGVEAFRAVRSGVQGVARSVMPH